MKIKMPLVMLLAVVMAFGGGCALFLIGGAAAAGAGGYAYVNGELKETEGVTLDAAYKATLAAMSDMQFAVVTKPKDAATATITVRNAKDEKIVITLNKQSATTTEVRVRVGTFGDENLSRQILDKIKSHF